MGWRACAKKCGDAAGELERRAAGILGGVNPDEVSALKISKLALALRGLGDDFAKLPRLEVEAPDAIDFRHAKLMDRFVDLVQKAEAWAKVLG